MHTWKLVSQASPRRPGPQSQTAVKPAPVTHNVMGCINCRMPATICERRALQLGRVYRVHCSRGWVGAKGSPRRRKGVTTGRLLQGFKRTSLMCSSYT
jgi:hypothetical protein